MPAFGQPSTCLAIGDLVAGSSDLSANSNESSINLIGANALTDTGFVPISQLSGSDASRKKPVTRSAVVGTNSGLVVPDSKYAQ
jgi:hypothetical protein